jgi:glycosyltransferase involved in cell wall biosynthesis
MPQAGISVIIPTFNRCDYITESLESAFRQTHVPFEVIVVDDGSTDDTAKRIERFARQITYLYQENRGVGAARNAGVAHSTGEFVAFLDSDDVWLPHKLALQMQTFQATPELEAIYGHARSAARLRLMAGRIQAAPLPCALLIRRSSLLRVGPFDESLRMGVEIDWYSRMQDCGVRMAMLGDVLYRRRLHRSNLNLTHADERVERLRALKTVLDRRRRII